MLPQRLRWLLPALIVPWMHLQLGAALPAHDERGSHVSANTFDPSVATSAMTRQDYNKRGHPPDGKNDSSHKLVASPAGLLRPDKFQFYTYNDKGDMITRQMTVQEIQGLIAAGGADHVAMDRQEPQKADDVLTGGKKVMDVVQKVQNVLKSALDKPPILTGSMPKIPEQANVEWSNILPSILSGEADAVAPSSSEPSHKLTTEAGSASATSVDSKKPAAQSDVHTNSNVYGGFANNIMEPSERPQYIHYPQQAPASPFSEKPMIPVPVITLTEHKLSTLQSLITESPVFQMLSVIPVGATESDRYPPKGQTANPVVSRPQTGFQTEEATEQFVELTLSEVPETSTSSQSTSSHAHPVSVLTQTTAHLDNKVGSAVPTVTYSMTAPSVSTASSAVDIKQTTGATSSSSPSSTSYALAGSKNNTKPPEASSFAQGVAKEPQVSGTRDDETPISQANTAASKEPFSPARPEAASNSHSPSTLASVSKIESSTAPISPHTDRPSEASSSKVTEKLPATATYMKDHPRPVESQSSVPMEPLPTQLIDSFSSVMSQISEAKPPVLPLSSTSGRLPEMTIVGVNHEHRRNESGDSNTLTSADTRPDASQATKVDENVAAQTYANVKLPPLDSVTRTTGYSIATKFTTTQRPDKTTSIVKPGVNGVSWKPPSAATFSSTSTEAMGNGAAANTVATSSGVGSTDTTTSPVWVQLERIQNASLDNLTEGPAILKVTATSVFAIPQKHTMSPGTTSAVTSSTLGATDKTHESLKRPTPTSEYFDVTLMNLNLSDPVSAIDQVLNIAPLPSSAPTVESISLPDDASNLVANNLASGLIAGFATSEKPAFEETSSGRIAEDESSENTAQPTVSFAVTRPTISVENVTQAHKESVTLKVTVDRPKEDGVAYTQTSTQQTLSTTENGAAELKTMPTKKPSPTSDDRYVPKPTRLPSPTLDDRNVPKPTKLPSVTSDDRNVPKPTKLPSVTSSDRNVPKPTKLPSVTSGDRNVPKPTKLPSVTSGDRNVPKPTKLPSATSGDRNVPRPTKLPSAASGDRNVPRPTKLPSATSGDRNVPKPTKLPSSNERTDDSTKVSSSGNSANIGGSKGSAGQSTMTLGVVTASPERLSTTPVDVRPFNTNKTLPHTTTNQDKKADNKQKVKTTEAPVVRTDESSELLSSVKVASIAPDGKNNTGNADFPTPTESSSKVATSSEKNQAFTNASPAMQQSIVTEQHQNLSGHMAGLVNDTKSHEHRRNVTGASGMASNTASAFAPNVSHVGNATTLDKNKGPTTPMAPPYVTTKNRTTVTSRPEPSNKTDYTVNTSSSSSSSPAVQKVAHTDRPVVKVTTQTSSAGTNEKSPPRSSPVTGASPPLSSANKTSGQSDKNNTSAQQTTETTSASEFPTKSHTSTQVNEQPDSTESKPASLKHSENPSKPDTRPQAPTTLNVPARPSAAKPTTGHKPLEKSEASKTEADMKDAEEKWTLISQQIPPVMTKPPKPLRKPPTNQPTSSNPDENVRISGTEPSAQQDDSSATIPQPVLPLDASQSASGLDVTVKHTSADIVNFAKLCNELAFNFWVATNKGLSTARSLALSPFGMTSLLAMIFLGARGPTSDQMNEILRLDDVATFNPHLVFQNITDTVSLARGQGIANAAFVRELFADKMKVRKLMPFYKEQAQQFYEGLVAEVNFATISDLVRRRTNLLIRKQTGGRIKDFVKTNTVPLRSPLAALSANVFQTDCNTSLTSSVGRDGELYFAVSPAVRQRRLVPVPATTWRSGVLAGYEPSIDATAVALGGSDKLVSTIFVLPGQQGHTAPGDTLDRLEQRLVRSAFRDGTWNKLLKALTPRSGLELQVPKFSHRSVVNATAALKRMGLDELFSGNADFKGINGVGHRLHLADVLQMNLFSTCGDENILSGRHHVETYPASPLRSVRRRVEDIHGHPGDAEDDIASSRELDSSPHAGEARREKRQLPTTSERPRLKLDRPFLYFVRHNPSGIILHMGRFNPRLLP